MRLVEDDRILRIPVRDAPQAAGLEVHELGDGTAALRAAESQPFDIVLSDVRLPGPDGLGLLRRLREVQPDMAVLLVTAHADAGDAVAAIREGARDYIVKPFELDELVLRIGRIREELEFRRRIGRFELADGGTLFLDEVGELSMPAQAKLLRVLEARSFEPVGSSQSSQVDVRIIAATNRDLAADVARGAFR